MMKSTPAALTAIVIFCWAGASADAQRQPQQEPPPDVIRVGTRLVEVEVVVRDKDGPVTGLTREDFTLLDQGKKQKIAEFGAGGFSGEPSGGVSKAAQPVKPGLPDASIPMDRPGHPVAGATVLLFDLLNTSFDNQGYARSQLLKALESPDTGEQIAIYMLGKNLSLAQDFTANRDAAKQAVRKWDPKDLFVLIQNTENMDAVDRGGMQCGAMCQEIRGQTTAQAIAKIAQNLTGMRGRKSLVWVSDTPGNAGSEILGAANIHLYPVLARGVGTSGVTGWARDTREAGAAGINTPPALASGAETERYRANAALAAASGGVAFMDSRDISTAARTAIEDARNTYILGFYPTEETLDNKFHMLTVELGKKGAARGRTLDVRYRPGYLAARAAPPATEKIAPNDVVAVNEHPTLNQLLQNPPDTSKLHLTAESSPDPDRPDSFRIKIHIDPHDLAPEHANERQSIAVDVSFHVEGSARVLTKTLKFQIPDGQFAAFLEKGIDTDEAIEAGSGAVVRVTVQDRATGAAGSVAVPSGQR